MTKFSIGCLKLTNSDQTCLIDLHSHIELAVGDSKQQTGIGNLVVVDSVVADSYVVECAAGDIVVDVTGVVARSA